MRVFLAIFTLAFAITLVLAAGLVVSTYAAGLPGRSEIVSALPSGMTILQDSLQGTPVPSVEFTETQILTATAPGDEMLILTPAPPLTMTVPITATGTPTPTQATWWAFFPIILRPLPEPRNLLVCSAPNLPIPDNLGAWVTDYLTINDPGQVIDVRAYVHIDHTWVGDLTARVEHLDHVAKLFDRPGVPDPPDGTLGCGQNNVQAIFDDGMERVAESKCFSSAPAVGGSFRPVGALSTFFGQAASGTWGLRVVDEDAGNSGTLVDWCLDLTVVDGTPTPTPTPAPASLPDSAYVSGMSGQTQAYKLDCETRSAVDWARHWGQSISEYEFFWSLPSTDNPETGFVGYVDGTWGLVPPNDYGVHAAPIAAQLRAYGLNAQARKYMRWDDLRAEIAAGRPVIVWILGTIWPGAPRYYAPGGGPYTVTAPNEHTMVLVGYSSDTVWLLNGGTILTRPLESFLDSWSALSNMGVVYVP